jgi:hypothetical protein
MCALDSLSSPAQKGACFALARVQGNGGKATRGPGECFARSLEASGEALGGWGGAKGSGGKRVEREGEGSLLVYICARVYSKNVSRAFALQTEARDRRGWSNRGWLVGGWGQQKEWRERGERARGWRRGRRGRPTWREEREETTLFRQSRPLSFSPHPSSDPHWHGQRRYMSPSSARDGFWGETGPGRRAGASRAVGSSSASGCGRVDRPSNPPPNRRLIAFPPQCGRITVIIITKGRRVCVCF